MNPPFIRVRLKPDMDSSWLISNLTRPERNLPIASIDAVLPKNGLSTPPRELIIHTLELPGQTDPINPIVQALWKLEISDVNTGRTEQIWPPLPPEESLDSV